MREKYVGPVFQRGERNIDLLHFLVVCLEENSTEHPWLRHLLTTHEITGHSYTEPNTFSMWRML